MNRNLPLAPAYMYVVVEVSISAAMFTCKVETLSVITEILGPQLKGQMWGMFRGSGLRLAGCLLQTCFACVCVYVCMLVCV